ncbi:MAG: Hpt domain-containing protein [Acidobacteriota bacterium]|nr:Hpt domain-containing protein [Acidobacteriota bacterium]
MSEPVLDAAMIDNLRQLTPPGEPDVLAEVLELFLQDVPRRIEKLRAAWAAGDAAELHKTAHSLKGSAGNIGAQTLFGVCRQLDDKGRAGDLTDAKPLVDALVTEYARVEVAIGLILRG